MSSSDKNFFTKYAGGYQTNTNAQQGFASNT